MSMFKAVNVALLDIETAVEKAKGRAKLALYTSHGVDYNHPLWGGLCDLLQKVEDVRKALLLEAYEQGDVIWLDEASLHQTGGSGYVRQPVSFAPAGDQPNAVAFPSGTRFRLTLGEADLNVESAQRPE